jgi:hypothetical protein
MMARWRYKHIRLNDRGRGITQEIDVLDVDGERLTGWGDSKTMPTVPQLFDSLGKDGWELVTHVIHQDGSGVMVFHYYTLRRSLDR